jgi:NADPH:quinone reductase
VPASQLTSVPACSRALELCEAPPMPIQKAASPDPAGRTLSGRRHVLRRRTATCHDPGVKAILVHPSPDGGHLETAEVAEPHADPGHVVIAVRAASVNRADLLVRRGTYDARGTGLPVGGLDCAGEILEVGEGVTHLAPGDRVMSMAGGAYAERVAVDARRPVPLPAAWSFVEGAAAVTGLMTEHDALRTGGLQPGETVVIHGAASGVGLLGVQLAAQLGARAVIAVVRRERPAAEALLEELGATHVVVAGDAGTFASAVAEATDGHGADLVIDHVGGPWLAETVTCLATYGRIVNIGRLGGAIGELDLGALAAKRARVIGSTFRIRSEDQIAEIVAAVRADVGDALAAGAIKAPVDRTFPLERAEAAHEHMARDGHLGKIVLEVS